MKDWTENFTNRSDLEWLGPEGAALDDHSYLFFTKKGETPFIQIQKQMHELNDFCVTLNNSMASATIYLTNRHDELLEATLEHGDDTYFDSTYDLYSLTALTYDCANFGRIYAPASTVLLLYATLIRSLHSIALHYGEKRYKHWQSSKDPRGAEIPPLKDLLESICKKKIEVFERPQVKALITERIRYLRNKFIHGDWAAVEKGLVGVNIRSCFAAVSQIFVELESLFSDDLRPSGKTEGLSFSDETKWKL